jgi:hypothetical protein
MLLLSSVGFNSWQSRNARLCDKNQIMLAYESRGSVLNRTCVCAAMLTVSNDEFWENVTPVDFGSLPRLQDAVTVVGYPIGGDTISVTSGVVSRIEVTSYVHGATELLGVQVRVAALQHGLPDDRRNVLPSIGVS